MKQLLIAIICLSLTSCYSKDNKNLAASDIQSDVHKGKDVREEDKLITGDWSLWQAGDEVQSAPASYCVYVNGAIVFRNCTFKGKVVAGYLDSEKKLRTTVFKKTIYFENCTFDDDVSFKGVTANGSVNFHNCNFNKSALFDGIIFHEGSSFYKCHFEETANFQSCSFMATNFNESVFMKTFSCQNSIFHEAASFNKISFNGYSDFSLASFNESFFCNYSTFVKKLVMNDCGFKGRTEFLNSTFGDAQMDNCLFYGLTLFQNSIFDKLSLQNSTFVLGEPKTTNVKITTLKMDNAMYGNGSKLLEGQMHGK